MDKYKVLNRDVIKYIAMLAMLLNHISHMFLTPGTLIAEVFCAVGFFTAPVMCYFIVEGYQYTRSPKKYAQRLLIFAIISQIPFMLAFKVMAFSMITTLLLCYLILYNIEHTERKPLRVFLNVALVLLSARCDWQIIAPLLVLFLANFWGNTKKMFSCYCIITFFMTLVTMIVEMPASGFNSFLSLISLFGISLLKNIFVVIAGIVLIFFYNGKRSEKHQKFSKWFFYIFYPGHLLVLYLIALLVK